jgi:hypothetical protein
MRRFALISSVVLTALVLSATAAWADPPTHVKKETFSDTFSAPAGQLCDFNYFQAFTGEQNIEVFGDPNNPTKVVTHLTIHVSHTNLDTGYTLTEVDRMNITIDVVNNVGKTVGIFWHLRDPTGKLVVVQAGQVLFDATTGELIKVTPAINPDFAAVICPALGGHPAI